MVLGSTTLADDYDPSFDSYNTLQCRPMTVITFTPSLADFGPNTMGAVLAMDIKPLTDITGAGVYQSVLKLRNANQYEVGVTLDSNTMLQVWRHGESVIDASCTPSTIHNELSLYVFKL